MTAPFDRRHHQNRALTRREHPHMTDVTVQHPARCSSRPDGLPCPLGLGADPQLVPDGGKPGR